MPNHTPSADRSKRPLDAAKLDELALAYVARFATSKGKLARYLSRKVAESKWIDAQNAQYSIEMVVDRMENLKFLDDRQYAEMKSGAMMRRGLGLNRVKAQLRQDGIGDSDRAAALEEVADNVAMAALRFAQRRRFGPFAPEYVSDPKQREKQLAAFLRAGHGMSVAREILAMEPEEAADIDAIAESLAAR